LCESEKIGFTVRVSRVMVRVRIRVRGTINVRVRLVVDTGCSVGPGVKPWFHVKIILKIF